MYRWAVFDLGRPGRFSFSMLDKVTDLLLVTTTGVPALYEAKRAIEALRRTGFREDRLKVIVNQFPGSQEFSRSQLAGFFGVPVYATFSPAGADLHDSCTQKKLFAKTSGFCVQIAALARRIAGLQPEKPRSVFSRIFSSSEESLAPDKRVSTAEIF
jgi:hypothetical protein